MSPTSYQTAPPRSPIITTASGLVKPVHGSVDRRDGQTSPYSCLDSLKPLGRLPSKEIEITVPYLGVWHPRHLFQNRRDCENDSRNSSHESQRSSEPDSPNQEARTWRALSAPRGGHEHAKEECCDKREQNQRSAPPSPTRQ